ncbi:acyl-CoA dehydrogenase [Sporomusa sp. KB1]|jgi:butyryl-CoA dehydrogenase|uniref:acyl-CoA dehydrogenase n=1 Tax=Sporomusa sp. KB1 TaxID=943346 RepID=UPI00119E6370|nr:acyl-CoA dehydrogenase [Sporomusa sp. KB1]TWH45519.1 butyryl-CoA dehydrogenase [Sporomusa sp. KB1]
MNFEFSKEHQLLRNMLKEFAEKEVKPLAAEIDEEERFPRETVEKLAKYGLLSLPYPKECGGAAADSIAFAMVIEEISKVCATTGIIISTHCSLGTYPIYAYGTPYQKEKYLPGLASGTKLGAFGLTEPGAGSDAAAQQTKAVLVGDHYVLNGTKTFITNAGEADYYTIMAMTDRSKGTKGISAFLVEKDFPGFRIGKHEKKMGIKGSSTGELIFEDCIVPKENLIGQEGKGFKIAMEGLDAGRVGIGAMALGIAQGALDETIKYVKERKQFGKRISEFQNTQFVLADLQAKVNAGRHLTYHAAWLKDQKKPYAYEAAMNKYYNSALASEVTTKCLQLFGGYGYMREYPLERMVRDAKLTEIGEGTNEVLRMVMGRSMGVI